MTRSFKNDLGLALLRIAPSAMLLTHGIPKLQRMLSGNFEFGDPIGIGPAPSLFLAILGEVVCPILIIFGYKTRWVALPPIVTMVVAAFIAHAGQPFGKKELALVYMVFFLVIMLLGPGSYSVDRK